MYTYFGDLYIHTQLLVCTHCILGNSWKLSVCANETMANSFDTVYVFVYILYVYVYIRST